MEQGLSSEQIQKIIEFTNTKLNEIEEENKADRLKYAGELDENKIEELIQRVTDWYANGNPNHYQVDQHLKNIGVDEKYYEEIRIEAHERVRRATHRAANWKIVIGIIISIIGLLILLLLFGAQLSGGGGAIVVRILVLPLVVGAAFVAWGLAQKNTI